MLQEARPTGLLDDWSLSSLPLGITRNKPIVPEVCPQCARVDPTPTHSSQLKPK